MTTTTDAPSLQIYGSLETSTQHARIIITLTRQPVGEELDLRFVTTKTAGDLMSPELEDASRINIPQLLSDCEHFTPYDGFKRSSDGKTLEVLYNFSGRGDMLQETQMSDILAKCQDRLRELLPKVQAARNAMFRRDVQTHFVSYR